MEKLTKNSNSSRDELGTAFSDVAKKIGNILIHSVLLSLVYRDPSEFRLIFLQRDSHLKIGNFSRFTLKCCP